MTNLLLVFILLAIIYSTDRGRKSIESFLEEIILLPIRIFFFPLTLYDYIKTRKEKINKSKKKNEALSCFTINEKELLKIDKIKDLSDVIRVKQDLDSFRKLENGQIDKVYLNLNNIYTTLYFIREEKIDELKDKLLKI